mmetsp:Transcript_18287/g.56305  ORF Transcript_18287/g.56305 Transcript_18287/m.56305 type:complete len:123 (+) Transcript_18287:81-449(+)
MVGEAGWQAVRFRKSSRVAQNLCNFPLGDTARARAASVRAVLKLYAMMCFIPGSAAPLLHVAGAVAAGEGGVRLWLPVQLVLYPAVAAWIAFVVFVKFAFVVFGLNTLAGFEDFDPPGWILG